MNGGHSVSLFCPECGQALVIPTVDLRSTFQCPRCGTLHNTGHLVPLQTPIPVAPVAAASPEPRVSQPSMPGEMAAPSPEKPSWPPQDQRVSTPYTPPIGTATPGSFGAPHTAAYHQGGYGPQGPYSPSAPPVYPASGPAQPHMPPPAPPSSFTPSRLPLQGRESVLTPAPNRVSAVEQIGGFGHWFLRMADKTDRVLYGRRTTIIAVLAAVTIFAGYYDNPRLPVLTVLFTLLFILLLFVLVTARIGSLRDEEGNWSVALLGQKISAWWEVALEFTSADLVLIVQGIGKTVTFLGLLVLGLRNAITILSLIADEVLGVTFETLDAADKTMISIGTIACVVGSLLILLAWLQARSKAKAQGLVLDDTGKAQLKSGVLGLPPIIDCKNVAQLQSLIAQTPHPLLKEVLVMLANWKPRNTNNEQAYHASLYRALRRRMPGANPEKERPIAEDTPEFRGRADLVVGDSILIEIKAHLTKGSVHRAIGQVRMYAHAWTQGPILVVVCGADRNHAHQLLSRELAELHQKVPVFMVLAAG